MLSLLALLAALSIPESAPEAAPAKIPVLVLSGGGYHDFEGNLATLIGALEPRGAFVFDRLRLDPKGDPANASAVLASDPNLRRYRVILAYTQGELGLSAEAKAGLMQFVKSGGGFVGFHCAADSHPGFAEYDAMVGGRFETHPPYGPFQVDLVQPAFPLMKSVAGLPAAWSVKDEFYHLKDCAADDKLVLQTGKDPHEGKDAAARPVSWVKSHGRGRVFYTVLGHGPDTEKDPVFVELVARALDWAAHAPQPDADGAYTLFPKEGGKDLAGWSHAGPGRFVVDNGELLTEGGLGLLWWHERRFRDFTLTVEWKTTRAGDNSGVYVRFPNASDDPWVAVNEGYEVQICDAAGVKGSGSVYSFADATEVAGKTPGEWNTYEITAKDQDFTVKLNGKTTCTYKGSRGREGFIGLQNHDDKSILRFRNVRVKEL